MQQVALNEINPSWWHQGIEESKWKSLRATDLWILNVDGWLKMAGTVTKLDGMYHVVAMRDNRRVWYQKKFHTLKTAQNMLESLAASIHAEQVAFCNKSKRSK